MAVAAKANILMVDDLPEKLLVYRTVLEELGQNIVAVGSGAEALKQVLKRDFAVILLDVNMPDIDGFETAELIRQRKRSAHTPIIFLTSFADEIRIQQGYATGAVDYIPAPVIPDILRAKVRVFVELFQMRQQVALQAEEQAKRAAAENEARRSAFLADASRALAATLDFEATLTALIRAAVPQLADLCLVTLRNAKDGVGRTVGARKGSALRIDFEDTANLDDSFVGLIRRVFTTGSREYRSQLPDGPVLRALSTEAALGAASDMAVSSMLIVPLGARGRILGAVTFARSPNSPVDLPDDVYLSEQLALRAAVALDNAILVRDIQEADRRKNEFLAMLAHELRNPLAPIRNAVHLLRIQASGDDKIAWARDVIDRQVNNLVRMVDDLLDVARINEGKIRLVFENLNATDLIERALEATRPLIDAHNHTVKLTTPPSPVYVRGDMTRLSQVLANLLTNAAKYTLDGGRIEVCVEAEGGYVVFRVRDNGSGIAPELIDKIFDLFTQATQSLDRAHGGLGIGLTLVRRLVEMHGGNVSACSDGLDRGSEFVVRLPAISHAISTEREVSVTLPVRHRSIRVLVVDDNRDIADSLAMIVQLQQHEVQIAHDGPTALDLAASFEPHVVFLDIGLPGMNGFDVAQRLREGIAGSSMLLVAISGYGQEEDLRKSRQAGFDNHLVKPVAPNLIHEILASTSEKTREPSISALCE